MCLLVFVDMVLPRPMVKITVLCSDLYVGSFYCWCGRSEVSESKATKLLAIW